jgi:hypothetical protein
MNQIRASLPVLPLPSICRLRLRYRVGAAGHLPRRKHAALRGLLGQALMAHDPALYQRLYAIRVAEDHPYARRFREAPAPYVVESPDRREAFDGSELLPMHFTLLGRAIELLPELMPVLERFGERGLGPEAVPLRLQDLEILPPLPAPEPAPTWHLRLHTPLRVVKGSELADPLRFDLLIHRLAERLSLLAHFHDSGPLIDDFTPWIEAAQSARILHSDLRPLTLHQHGAAKQKPRALTGWVGRISYTDVHPDLVPLLHTGSLVRLGKGAPWGMGRFSVSREQGSR